MNIELEKYKLVEWLNYEVLDTENFLLKLD